MPADPDSRARTHLANERTFLAWLRTGVTLIALGLAAAQFLTHDVIPGFPVIRIMAVMLVAGGVTLAGIGAWRYRQSERQIEAGQVPIASCSLLVGVGLVAVVGLLALVFIVSVRG